MRQPAGQLSDGLHLLAVQQRLFQPLTLDAVDLHLRGFLFQQTCGVLKRGGVAGKNVKRARQLAQLVAPLQRRNRNILFTVGKSRHRPGDGRQVGAQIAVDIPAGAAGDDQRQHGEDADKHADGLQLVMALGRAKPGSLRHLFNVLINIAIKDRHQRLNVEHIPTDGQIALLQLLRQRGKLAQLGVKIGQNALHDRLYSASGQRGGHGVQLLNGSTRRRCINRGRDQPIHLHQLPCVRHVAAEATVDVLKMA